MNDFWGRMAGRAAVAAMGLWTVGLATGCGNFGAGFFQNPNNPTTTTSGSDYVYSVNSDNTISAFSVAAGGLTAISGNPINAGTSYSVTVDHGDGFVYAGGGAAIYCFRLNSGGALTEESSSGISVPSGNVVAMDTSSNGEFLAALAYTLGVNPTLYIYSINTSTGALTQAAAATLAPTGTIATPSLRFSPNNAYVGIALAGAGDVVVPIAEPSSTTATLGTAQYLTPSSGYEDNFLLFDSTSSYAYVGRYGNTAGSGSIVTFSVGASGVLTQLSSVAAGNDVRSLAFNSAGTDLYAANYSDGTISGYSIQSGVLTPLTGSPFSSIPNVSSLALDNSGKYLIAAVDETASTSSDLVFYEFDVLTGTQLDAVATIANGTGVAGSTAVAATH